MVGILWYKKLGVVSRQTWLDEVTFGARRALFDLTIVEGIVIALYGVCAARCAVTAGPTAWRVQLAFVVYMSVAGSQYNAAKRDPVYVLGQLTAVHMSLALIPIDRNSVWQGLIGISFERAIKWHRILGR